MKKILVFTLVFYCFSAQAQQFSFQMFFTDAIGNRDTLTLGYDTAATILIDASFGEVNIIGVPLDSVFDVRITDEWDKQGQGTFHTKKQIVRYNCVSPIYNIQSIDIKAKHWPVTATWDKTLFNDSCRDWSDFKSQLGDIGGYSDLNWVKLISKDSVTFTSNVSPWGGGGSYAYINNASDTIPVFFQTFIDSLHAFSIKEQYKIGEVKVFPNPASNYSSIDVKEEVTACFYNTLGQLVLTTGKKENIDISTLPQGLYLIRIAYKSGQSGIVKFQKI
jgi:hypothetical protein